MKSVDESVIKRFLAGVSEECLRRFWQSHDTLSSGSLSILNEGGDVGRSLFSAGMGGVDIKSILADSKTRPAVSFSKGAETNAEQGFERICRDQKASSV
jgi:hypothetical protein